MQGFRYDRIALEESMAYAGFFLAEICFTLGQILFTRENLFFDE